MDDESKPKVRQSTEYFAMGLGVGAIGAIGAVVGAAACPVCVVATPALLGMGLYKRWTERRRPQDEPPPDATETDSPLSVARSRTSR